MTPRSVSMGNKVYKLHVRCGSRKETWDMSPDAPLLEFQNRVAQTFQVPFDEQKILCNGKQLSVDSRQTMKQAKIPNGSKIVIQPCQNLAENLSVYENRDLEPTDTKILEDIEQQGVDIENSVTALDRDLANMRGSGDHLARRCEDLKRVKLECGKLGELLMRLFEKLDAIHFTDEQSEAKAKRKHVANFLNQILDRNDAVVFRISEELLGHQNKREAN